MAFDFCYTFTPEDAAIRKVTFKAVASVGFYRDALPADNEAGSARDQGQSLDRRG